jgi:transmembrane 9 superfamily protein 2/4
MQDSKFLIHRFIFAVVFLLNLFLIFAGSSGAVPFGMLQSQQFDFADNNMQVIGTMLAVLLLWFIISVPLTVIGAYVGHKHGVRIIFPSFSSSHPVNNCQQLC